MTQKHETIQTALTVAFFVALFVSFVYVASFGISKAERIECKKWAEEMRVNLSFYPASWQELQCEYHGMELPEI